MRKTAFVVALSIAAAFTFGATSVAFGAVTLGAVAPPGTTTPTGYANALEFQHHDGGGAPSYASPIAGVVTSFSLRTGNAVTPGDSVRLAVVRNYPDPPYDEKLITEGNTQPIVGLANSVVTFPAQLPVAAGDRLGYVLTTNTGTMPYYSAGSPYGGNEVWEFLPAPPVESLVDSSQPHFFSHTLYLMNLAVTVEPDADQDGFGDETQDACPTQATTQGPCQKNGSTSDTTPPVISAFTTTQKRFRVSAHGVAISKHAPAGSMIALSLSESARVTFSINRHASGRVVGGSCRRATHKKSQGAKKCTLGQVADVFTKLLPVGASSFAFSGRYKSSGKVSSLKPGRYSLYATATDAAGNIGPQSGLSFQIVK